MSKNITKEYKLINYKGKILYLTEDNISFILGFRFKTTKGKEIISINCELSLREKQLQLHRLITGRGLRGVRNSRSKYA